MKRTKLNLLGIAALAGLMACGPMARGQDNGAPPAPPKPPVPAPGGDTPAPPPRPARPGMARGMQDALAKLDLSADQKEKVGAAMKAQRDKTMALRADSTLSQDDRRAKAKDIRSEFDTAMKGILTSDQYTKWQDMQKTMRGPGGRPPGAPTPPDAPPAPAPAPDAPPKN